MEKVLLTVTSLKRPSWTLWTRWRVTIQTQQLSRWQCVSFFLLYLHSSWRFHSSSWNWNTQERILAIRGMSEMWFLVSWVVKHPTDSYGNWSCFLAVHLAHALPFLLPGVVDVNATGCELHRLCFLTWWMWMLPDVGCFKMRWGNVQQYCWWWWWWCDVSFYNSTASTWTLATPRTTWESLLLFKN